jgi:hypothetical protein
LALNNLSFSGEADLTERSLEAAFEQGGIEAKAQFSAG